MGELRHSADCLQRTGMKSRQRESDCSPRAARSPGEGLAPSSSGRCRPPSEITFTPPCAQTEPRFTHAAAGGEGVSEHAHTPGPRTAGAAGPRVCAGQWGAVAARGDARARREGQGRPAAPPSAPPPAPGHVHPPQEAGRTRVPSAAPPQPSRGGPWSTSSSSTPLCASASSSCRLL